MEKIDNSAKSMQSCVLFNVETIRDIVVAIHA